MLRVTNLALHLGQTQSDLFRCALCNFKVAASLPIASITTTSIAPKSTPQHAPDNRHTTKRALQSSVQNGNHLFSQGTGLRAGKSGVAADYADTADGSRHPWHPWHPRNPRRH